MGEFGGPLVVFIGTVALYFVVQGVLGAVRNRPPVYTPDPLPDFSAGFPSALQSAEKGVVVTLKNDVLAVRKGSVTYDCPLSTYKSVAVTKDFKTEDKGGSGDDGVTIYDSSWRWHILVTLQNTDISKNLVIARCDFIAIEGDEWSPRVRAAVERMKKLAQNAGDAVGVPTLEESVGDVG